MAEFIDDGDRLGESFLQELIQVRFEDVVSFDKTNFSFVEVHSQGLIIEE